MAFSLLFDRGCGRSFFWYVIDVFYYWTYNYTDRKTPARTLLFPRCFFSNCGIWGNMNQKEIHA